MRQVAVASRPLPLDTIRVRLLAEAQTIRDEDIGANRAMGDHGAALVPPDARILTHCNAGALATAGYGTALGVVRAAHAQGKVALVWVDETRPVMQGSRLTAWECVRDGHPAPADRRRGRGVGDGARRGRPGRDRRRPDRRQRRHRQQDRHLCAGRARRTTTACRSTWPRRSRRSTRRSPRVPQIPIEERDASEVRRVGGQQTAPSASPVYNPAFDVTPAELIAAIVTERGVFRPPYRF